MQQFACLHQPTNEAVYLPLHGFTAVDLGSQPGNAVSNFERAPTVRRQV